MPRLDLRICGAKNLPNTETFGKIDPYCTVSFEGKQWRTKVAENTMNPNWDEVFKFNVSDADSSRIHFVIWDDNFASDDFLGEYYMSISGLDRGKVEEKWVLLQNCKGNAELHIRLMAVDFGDLPPEEQEETQPHPEPPRQMPAGYQPPPPQYFAQPPPQQPYYAQQPPPQQPYYAQQPPPQQPYAQQPPPQQPYAQQPPPQQQQQQQVPGVGDGVPSLFPIPQDIMGREVLIRTHHGTVLTAMPDHGPIITSLVLSSWQRFVPESGPYVGTIRLRTHHGTYVRCNPGPNGALDNVDSQGDWEVWTVAAHSAGYSLRSFHNTVIQVPPGEDTPVIGSDTQNIGSWEGLSFELPPQVGVPPIQEWNGRVVRIRSRHGTVLSALPGDAGAVQSTLNTGLWETFTVQTTGTGQIRLRTHHGSHVRCNPGNNALVDNVMSEGEWELWYVEANPGAEGHGLTLRSWHGTHLHIRPGENQQALAVEKMPGQLGDWERVYLQLEP